MCEQLALNGRVGAIHLSDLDVFPMRDLWGTLLWLYRRSGADMVMSQENDKSNTGSILYIVNNRTKEVCWPCSTASVALCLVYLGCVVVTTAARIIHPALHLGAGPSRPNPRTEGFDTCILCIYRNPRFY